MSLSSTSARFHLNWVDILKALRTGATVLISTFGLGVMNALPGILSSNREPQAIANMIFIAGASAILDLARRWLTDHSSEPLA